MEQNHKYTYKYVIIESFHLIESEQLWIIVI